MLPLVLLCCENCALTRHTLLVTLLVAAALLVIATAVAVAAVLQQCLSTCQLIGEAYLDYRLLMLTC
jgi:hypothetical protein